MTFINIAIESDKVALLKTPEIKTVVRTLS